MVEIRKKTYKEAADNFFKDIIDIVEKAESEINEYYGKNSHTYVTNLLKYDLFKSANQMLTQAKIESLGIASYETVVPMPLTEQFENDQHNFICEEIVDSFVQNRISVNRDAVANGIIANYKRLIDKNNNIYNDNIEKIGFFYGDIAEMVQDYFIGNDKRNNSVQERINKIKDELDEKKDTNENEKIHLTANITKYRAIMTENPLPEIQPTTSSTDSNLFESSLGGVNETLSKDDTESSTVNETMVGIGEVIRGVGATLFAPFKSLGRGLRHLGIKFADGLESFFLRLGEHIGTFSSFISNISESPVFWISPVLAFGNGYFFYRLFTSMFVSSSIALMFITIYIIAFTLLPPVVAKFVYEIYYERGNIRENATFDKVILYSIISFLILLVISYLTMTVRHQHIYIEEGQEQILAIVVISFIPLITSLTTFILNYKYLVNKSSK